MKSENDAKADCRLLLAFIDRVEREPMRLRPEGAAILRDGLNTLTSQLAAKQHEVERLARKVCLALVAFPESVQELITAATEYDDLVDSTPETDPSEIVAWDELCHEAYESAEQILAALSPEASET